MDGPYVVYNGGARRDAPALVVVFLHGGVRDAQDDGRHPAQRLFDAGADVREVLVVFDRGQAVWTNDSVDFFLDFSLHVWPDETGEDEAVEDGSSGV